MCFFKRQSGPRYVVLEMDKPTEDERDAAEYRGAYLLLLENVRMQLRISTLQPRRRASQAGIRYSAHVSARVSYTTESLQPHRIASFEEFEQHTPYQEGWVVQNRLSVHPEDVDKAIHVLGKAGIEAKTESGRRSW
ncbi:MAG: hypothetical protein OXL97_03575 [Chloroflexota bacterium]|nr:hypothetical protein [Chloroflexota bacterium]MDE2886559.1 hypothetical protein [Chloroflexota bacterium]